MTWKVLRIPGHSEKFWEISGTPVRQMGQEDPVLLVLVPVEEEGEEDGDDNEDSGGDVGRIGPFSEEVLRPGILGDPNQIRPEMRLTLTEVQQTQCCGQSQGSQHVDKSPVPVQRHPPCVRTLVNLAKGEVAKDWEDDEGWVVDDHPCSILQTSQGLAERGECNDGT